MAANDAPLGNVLDAVAHRGQGIHHGSPVKSMHGYPTGAEPPPMRIASADDPIVQVWKRVCSEWLEGKCGGPETCSRYEAGLEHPPQEQGLGLICISHLRGKCKVILTPMELHHIST